MAKKSKWVKRWEVPSDTRADTSYVVAIDADGNWGCSCPVWKFQRVECKHIRYVKDHYGEGPNPDPDAFVQPRQQSLPPVNRRKPTEIERPKKPTSRVSRIRL